VHNSPSTKSPRQLYFVLWHLIFEGPQYGANTCPPSGTYNSEVAPRFLEICTLRPTDSMSECIWTNRMINEWTARDLKVCSCALITVTKSLSQYLSGQGDDWHSKPHPRLLLFSHDSNWALYEDKSTGLNNYTHLPDTPVLWQMV